MIKIKNSYCLHIVMKIRKHNYFNFQNVYIYIYFFYNNTHCKKNRSVMKYSPFNL